MLCVSLHAVCVVLCVSSILYVLLCYYVMCVFITVCVIPVYVLPTMVDIIGGFGISDPKDSTDPKDYLSIFYLKVAGGGCQF